jgi:hypothetical protein
MKLCEELLELRNKHGGGARQLCRDFTLKIMRIIAKFFKKTLDSGRGEGTVVTVHPKQEYT